MKIIISQVLENKCHIDELLLHDVRKLQNGANVHCLANILTAYINACQMYNRKKTDNLKVIVDRTKKRLQDFVASGGRVCK